MHTYVHIYIRTSINQDVKVLPPPKQEAPKTPQKGGGGGGKRPGSAEAKK